MQCRATGNPQPKIYWLKDMKRVNMSNSRYSLIDGKQVKNLYIMLIYIQRVYINLCNLKLTT